MTKATTSIKEQLSILLKAVLAPKARNSISAFANASHALGIEVLPELQLELRTAGDPHTVKGLLRAIRNFGPAAAGAAAEVLSISKLENKELLPEMESTLTAMGPIIVPTLRDALLRGHSWESSQAAKLLSRFGGNAAPAREELLALARSGSGKWPTRHSIAALGAIGDARDIPVILAALKDLETAPAAIKAISAFGTFAVRQLLTQLESAGPQERQAVQAALISIGEGVVGYIAHRLDDPRIGQDVRIVLQTLAREGKLTDSSLLPRIFPAGT